MVDDAFMKSAPTIADKEEFTPEAIPIPLPSKGVLYEPGHPLHMKETMSILPMGMTEEHILTTPELIQSGKIADALIVSTAVNKRLDPEDLLVGDKNAILAGIRISGFGPEYVTKVVCPKCKKAYKSNFMLNKLELQGLNLEGNLVAQPEENKNVFETTLPISKAKVKFKLLTQKEQNEITEGQENRAKAMRRAGVQTNNVNTMSSDKFMKSILSVNGKEDGEFIRKFIFKMRTLDIRFFKKLMRNIEPKLLMHQDSQCPNCQHVELDKRIPMTVDFFWPEEID